VSKNLFYNRGIDALHLTICNTNWSGLDTQTMVCLTIITKNNIRNTGSDTIYHNNNLWQKENLPWWPSPTRSQDRSPPSLAPGSGGPPWPWRYPPSRLNIMVGRYGAVRYRLDTVSDMVFLSGFHICRFYYENFRSIHRTPLVCSQLCSHFLRLPT